MSRRQAATCDGCFAGFKQDEIELAQNAAPISAWREHVVTGRK